MGVQQFLGKVLPTAGREIDLRNYADVHGRDRRPLRIAVDIASVVYQATQGFGVMLADERYMDNYGRAELRRREREAAEATEGNGNNGTAAKPNPENDPQIQEYIQRCTQHVMDFINQFKQANIDVLVVLDGATPPIKTIQVKQRSEKRKDAEAKRDASVEDTEISVQARLTSFRRAGAGKHFTSVIDGVVALMRSNHIPFLVSPFESDGQLAFLSEKRYVDLIVTEDSDLLACGASPVMYKVSIKKKDTEMQDGICGTLLRMEDLSCSKDLDLMDFSSAMLATVFIAVGSDYCEKLKGIGIKTACDAARKAFHVNPEKVNHLAPLEIFFQLIYKASYTTKFSDEFKQKYEARFLGALLMFRHPVVFNPIRGRCETFRLHNPDPELMLYGPYAELLNDSVARAKFVGEPFPSPLACYLAEGWLNPRTMLPRQFARLPDQVHTCYKEWKRTVYRTSLQDQNVQSKESDLVGDSVDEGLLHGKSQQDAMSFARDDNDPASLAIDGINIGVTVSENQRATHDELRKEQESAEESPNDAGFETQPIHE